MDTKRDSDTSRQRGAFSRRRLIAGAALSLAAPAPTLGIAAPTAKARYRVAVIGHTGRGNYGHGLDLVWLGVPGVQVVAVAIGLKSTLRGGTMGV